MKKKKAKKKAKKTAKKKAKKTAKSKTKSKPSKRKPKGPVGLHEKKLQIMREVPEMPCSAFGRDNQGLRFAHTQAEKVYAIYRQKTLEYGLTIRNIDLVVSNIKYTDEVKVGEDWKKVEVTAVLCAGNWEIRDNATGQTEEFGGIAIGDNYVWSANSAQTVAKKQALLDYFETAWPQPTDWAKLVRESLEGQGTNFVEALKMILPQKAYEIMEATTAIKELEEFYGKEISCQKPQSKK